MIYWSLFVIIGVILDFGTKSLAENLLLYGEPIPVIPGFLNWTLAYNPGAAFSFLADQAGWQRWFFIGITVVIAIVLFFWIKRTDRVEKLLRFGLACVLVGAIGNLIDRVVLGHVIDFIHVTYNGRSFPIFNVADIFVTSGVGLIILSSFTEKKRKLSQVADDNQA
ncbi:signal peptidase II [Ignatzschineria rhizosphaerae]|uniref:Lipoprotein signal peptidase n=1 Tax=Ignatzschineria rhizosphaerae TaxID=2923279 RepID=A0ABY3WXE4_9GAMM|nr:signal peptidase II [Ignatzschineria rhizosphaerae]UNM95278.1 signal peptidase II [Ignatzschineria rhizosphaerae]